MKSLLCLEMDVYHLFIMCFLNGISDALPYFALVLGIHLGAFGTLEVFGELFHVAHWAEDAEHAGRVCNRR